MEDDERWPVEREWEMAGDTVFAASTNRPV